MLEFKRKLWNIWW